MAQQSIDDLVNSLPKPETLEEQYMYALVCSVASVTPRYGVSSQAAFKRLEQYWKAFWLVAAAKFKALETPAADTVSSDAIQNDAVTNSKVAGESITVDKLARDVASRLWATDRTGSVLEAMLEAAVQNRLLGSGNVQTGNIADKAVTKTKIANGSITSAHIENGTIKMEDLDQAIQDKLNSIH